jgi:hypothetical protein
MSKDHRDSLREGLKTKGRLRRQAAARHAAAEKASKPRRNDILPSLQIESYPVEALKSHVRRLRKSDPAHIREIANSISTLGFNVPLLVGKGNVVVDGDSRLEAAKLLGLASVPGIRVDHLNETEQRLLRLAVNRLGEKGFWDLGELEAEFKELIIADAPIEISGFGSDEIDQILIGNEDGEQAGNLVPLPGASAIARVNDNLWTCRGASSLGSDARKGLQDHPTVKPVAMLGDALIDLTNRGEIVIDPFLGSGSTLIAAENTGRVCCGIELDPLYVDVIIRRYEAETGVTAILTETGETFEDLAARRSKDQSAT